MIFNITHEQNGKNVLSFLKSTLHLSNSALAALKRDPRGIEINGRHVTVRYILKEKDILFLNEIDTEITNNDSIPPINIPLKIVYENEDIMLIDKPANMPTHPSHGHIDDTLANGVAYIFRQRNIPFVFRPIGRLDRNTSGISLIAKHQIAASYLFYARQRQLIRKKYIAILQGRIECSDELNTIDTYMKRQEESIIVRCVSSADEEGSFRAITHWRLLFSNDDISIVEAIPETGRTHQLRVHFAHIGHPILGDDVYGSASDIIDRHALHAAYLSIPLPYGEEMAKFCTDPPEDMISAANKFGCDLIDVYNTKFCEKI